MTRPAHGVPQSHPSARTAQRDTRCSSSNRYRQSTNRWHTADKSHCRRLGCSSPLQGTSICDMQHTSRDSGTPTSRNMNSSPINAFRSSPTTSAPVQATHAEPLDDAVPAVHDVHVAAPLEEIVPGPQARHALADVVFENVPAINHHGINTETAAKTSSTLSNLR